jgi:hypothetical protein
MSYTRYPSAGGSGVQTYADEASLPASAVDGTLAITIDSHTLWVFDSAGGDWVAIANETTVGTAQSYRAGSSAIPIDTDSIVVNFNTAMSDANYSLQLAVENLVDSTPIFLQPVVTGKFAYGFSAKFNPKTDTANYSLNYKATKSASDSAGELALLSGAVSASIAFSQARVNANYAVSVSVQNINDLTPIFISCIITAKTVSGFTVVFNAPTDTANYALHYTVTGDQ